VGAAAVVLAATALVAAAWQGYAKLPPGVPGDRRALTARLHGIHLSDHQP